MAVNLLRLKGLLVEMIIHAMTLATTKVSKAGGRNVIAKRKQRTQHRRRKESANRSRKRMKNANGHPQLLVTVKPRIQKQFLR